MDAEQVITPEPAPAPQDTVPPRSIWQAIFQATLAVIVAGVFGLLAFHLSTRNNDFPLFYHPDEWSKVGQIRQIEPDFNFNHPLLMLRAAKIYAAYSQPGNNQRELVDAGRRTSALFNAVTVFALSLAGFATCRFAGLFIVGAAISTCPSLIVHGHYFKEDTSLIVGIAITVLGAALHCASKQWWNKLLAAIILGIGCALAASGKYVGVAVVAPALATLAISKLSKWWITIIQIVLMLTTALALAVWINVDAFEDPWTLKVRPDISQHVENEYGHATGSEWMHGIMVIKTPSLFCARLGAHEIRPHLWIITSIAIIGWLIRPWVSRWMITIILFLLSFIIVLAYNAIPIPRYALPITVLGYFACAIALSAVINRRMTNFRVRTIIAIIAFAIIGGIQLRLCAKLNHQFADDSRQRLRDWIATLPANAIVVGERYSSLDRFGGDNWRFPNAPRLKQVIIPCNFAADYVSMENLKRRRINYVVIAEPAYGRYLYPECIAAAGDEAEFEQTRTFYRHLLNDLKPVWQSDPDPPSGSYVNPTIRVYEVNPPAIPAPRKK